MDGFGESLTERLRKDEDEGFRGRGSFARAKSGDKDESLGCETDGVDLDGKPRNWDVRSSNCIRRCSAWSRRSADAELLLINMRFISVRARNLTSRDFVLSVSVLVLKLRCPLASSPRTLKCVHPGNWARGSKISLAAVQVMKV